MSAFRTIGKENIETQFMEAYISLMLFMLSSVLLLIPNPEPDIYTEVITHVSDAILHLPFSHSEREKLLPGIEASIWTGAYIRNP